MTKQVSYKVVSLIFGVLVICFAIGFYVFAAWQEPSVAPPSGNVPAPINTGGVGQVKKYINSSNKGWLGIGVDNYDQNYSLTVGYNTNKLGIKVRGNSYFQGATSDNTSAVLNIVNDAGTNLLYIRNDGNVGIGTTSPNDTLTVNGPIRTMPQSTATCNATHNGAMYYDSEDHNIYFCRNGSWSILGGVPGATFAVLQAPFGCNCSGSILLSSQRGSCTVTSDTGTLSGSSLSYCCLCRSPSPASTNAVCGFRSSCAAGHTLARVRGDCTVTSHGGNCDSDPVGYCNVCGN